MQKRAFIIHGWGGHPREGWFPWLKQELESQDFEVFIPQLPQTKEPRINNWVPSLKEAVGIADEQTYFIGHSLGCETIIRYLEGLDKGIKVGGAVFVAGFLKRLTNIDEDEVSKSIENEWLKSPLDLEKVKLHLEKSVAIFSDNDQYVPLDNQDEFKNILGSKIIVENNRGHFSGSNGVVELPVVLEAILKMAE